MFKGRARGRGRGLQLVPASTAHVSALRKIVATDPVRHVHTAARMGPARRSSSTRLWALVDGGRTIGGLLSCRGFAWALEPPSRLDDRIFSRFASFISARAASPEIVVGPRDEVEAVVDGLTLRGLEALELREQVMMAATALRPEEGLMPTGFRLRSATARDLPWLLETHAAMCREDLGVDQVAKNRVGYERYFLDLIAGDQVLVGEDAGERVYKSEVALKSAQAWLIEGVYTLPPARGRGFARAAMASVAEKAAEQDKLACLYVHLANEAALSVYRRVGFQEVCPWTTALLSRGGAY